MKDDVKIYLPTNSEMEIHMVGDWVGVCWNLKSVTKKLQHEGTTYKAKTWKRRDKPYISFVWVRSDGDGECWVSDDNPVDGGFSAGSVPDIIQELEWAVEYINSL